MKRDKEAAVKTFMEEKKQHSNVLIVNGPRQTGKTFLVDSVLQNYTKVIKINLEKMTDVKLEIDQAKDFHQFTRILETKFQFKNDDHFIVFIDEAQESETLGKFVRDMKESWSHTKTILTGSSMHRLFQEEQRIPVGRLEYLTLYPFSFREFLRAINKERLLELANEDIVKALQVTPTLHRELIHLFDDYLKTGGLPEVVLTYAQGGQWTKNLQFIFATQKDDFLRKDKIKSHLFLDAMKGVSNHVGSIAKFVHVSENKYDAKKVLQLLQDWHLVHEINIASGQTTQAISEKRYLYDLGMLRLNRTAPVPELSVISTLDEALRLPLGGIIENAVMLMALNLSQMPNISCWRKNNREPIEVDFILKTIKKTLPLEVKATLRITNRHAKNLCAYALLNKVDFGVIASFDNYQEFNFSAEKIKVKNIPVYFIEEYLQQYF